MSTDDITQQGQSQIDEETTNLKLLEKRMPEGEYQFLWDQSWIDVYIQHNPMRIGCDSVRVFSNPEPRKGVTKIIKSPCLLAPSICRGVKCQNQDCPFVYGLQFLKETQ